MPPRSPRLYTATFEELDVHTLYALLRLRTEVFVVEQKCPYPDLDGRDTEPETRHLWYADVDGPVAYLRILAEAGETVRIGRVVVAPRARGGGLGHRLMADALNLVGTRTCRLDAQAHLTDFYARHGFAADGPRYLEDGIPHLPMRRTGR